jgi:hypothetical protein
MRRPAMPWIVTPLKQTAGALSAGRPNRGARD